MRRVWVESSVLASVGYRAGTLEVEFVGGSVYRYLDVPARVHAELMWATSHGRYFTEHIRNDYRCVRL